MNHCPMFEDRLKKSLKNQPMAEKTTDMIQNLMLELKNIK